MPPTVSPIDLGLALLAAALLLEALLAYPAWLYARIGHPVTWMGALIAWLEARLNERRRRPGTRRFGGAVALLLLLGVTFAVTAALQVAALALLPAFAALLLLALLASSLLAQRSLHSFVGAVAEGLEREGLPGGRKAVAHIVGRDPEALDEGGVSRAAIESLAENFSDGVVAPALYCALGGLPGIALYKAVNTADSMIGHKSARYHAFGWTAARLDDLVNLPASRLAAFWLLLAACLLPKASPRGAWRAVWRDAKHHRSPNAGWPEAAMAGALGLRLAGPRRYGDRVVDDRWQGDGRAEATAADVRRALALYRLALVIQATAVLGLATALWLG